MSQSENQEIQSILNARQAQLEKLQYLMDSLSMELQQMSSLLENTDWPFLAPLAVTAGSEQNHAVSHSFNITSTPPAVFRHCGIFRNRPSSAEIEKLKVVVLPGLRSMMATRPCAPARLTTRATLPS